jgi:hypothetical protein
MTATLYRPNQLPTIISIGNSVKPSSQDYAHVTEQIAELLGCSSGMVDVLAKASTYIAYSIFDAEGEVNLTAMAILRELTGQSFDPDVEDELIMGNVLIVSSN